MVKYPPLDNFPSNCIPPTLLPFHNAPALLVGSPVSHHHKNWKLGGGSLLLSRWPHWCGSRRVGATQFLGGRPRAEWWELTPQPFDDKERNEKIFAQQTRWKLNRSQMWRVWGLQPIASYAALLIHRSTALVLPQMPFEGGGGGGGAQLVPSQAASTTVCPGDLL